MTFPPPSEYIIKFIRSEKVSQDGYSFHFEKPKGLAYLPGQYVRMTLPHENMDERGNGRFFSLASSPLDPDIQITTRIVQSTFKKTLVELAPNAEVKVFGPVGRFVFSEEELNPRIFLAGGIGVTPFHSIIRYIAAKNIVTPVTLFASFTTPEEMVFLNELQRIAENHKNIKIIYTATKPELTQIKWDGEVGRITDVMIKKYYPDISDVIAMSCGPGAMLESMVKLMTDLGVSPQNNRKELFTGY